MRLRSYLALIFAVLLLQVPVGRAQVPETAQYVGTYVWQMPQQWFGGFSGLEIDPDGRKFVILSDRAHYAEGQLTRAADGRITGATLGPLTRVLGAGGKRMPLWKTDSEGLAITPSGRVYISFEEIQQVIEYPRLGAPGRALPRDPAFTKMSPNGSLETLAVDDSGALYTLPESGRVGQPIQVYRYANGKWTHPFTLPRPDWFHPVGADFGPDGKLYLLERRFSGIFGFSTRVLRLTLGRDGQLLKSEKLLQTFPGQFDNLEGIAVWRDGAGNIRLTMISDDNFSIFQRTEFVDFLVPANAAGEAKVRS